MGGCEEVEVVESGMVKKKRKEEGFEEAVRGLI